jgi:alpha-mannosidase
VEPASIVVSALRTAEDGAAVVRLYEASGRRTEGARVRLPSEASRADLADLLERPIGDLPLAEGVVTLGFGPFEIKTLRVGLARA